MTRDVTAILGMKAQANNYYEHGWYAYMARWDVESVVDCVQQIQALVESNERLTKTKLKEMLHGEKEDAPKDPETG